MILEALPHCRARGEIDGSLALRDIEKVRARGVNRVCLPLWAHHGVGFFERNRTVFDENLQKSSKGPRVHFFARTRKGTERAPKSHLCAVCARFSNGLRIWGKNEKRRNIQK